MDTNQFEVIATALNLRARPSRDADILAVLRRGQTCLATGAAIDGWMPVAVPGIAGFVSPGFVRPLAPIGVQPATAGSMMSPARVDPEFRDRDMSHLHPTARQRVDMLMQRLAAEELPFRVFEAFRTPERQEWLYAQGRTRAGGVVTKSRAWQSFHQFGMAVDLVLFIDGNWSWDDTGARAKQWQRMAELASDVGLRSLSWERPHAELPVSLATCTDASMLASGDVGWRDNLAAAADRWRLSGGEGAPVLPPAERPPLPPAEP